MPLWRVGTPTIIHSGDFTMRKLVCLLILMLPIAFAVTGCEKGPAEKAGEKIDKAVGN